MDGSADGALALKAAALASAAEMDTHAHAGGSVTGSPVVLAIAGQSPVAMADGHHTPAGDMALAASPPAAPAERVAPSGQAPGDALMSELLRQAVSRSSGGGHTLSLDDLTTDPHQHGVVVAPVPTSAPAQPVYSASLVSMLEDQLRNASGGG